MENVAQVTVRTFRFVFHTGEHSRKEVLEQIFQEAKGSSGDTAKAMVRYLKEVGPLLLLWENVEELLQQHNAENLQVLVDIIEAAGYTCNARRYKARDYFACCERNRAFGLCAHVEKSGLSKGKAQAWVNATVADVKDLANDESLRSPVDVILDDNHWYTVVLTASGYQSPPACPQSGHSRWLPVAASSSGYQSPPVATSRL